MGKSKRKNPPMPEELTPEIADRLFRAGLGKQLAVEEDGPTKRVQMEFTPEEVWEKMPEVLFQLPATERDKAIHERLGMDSPMAYFVNLHYQVAVWAASTPEGFPDMVHLSVKRRDRKPIDKNRWRILQRLKNIIVGPECEGVEIYPKETRLVDTANQYHLWVMVDPQNQWPFGFNDRLVANESGETSGTTQRDASYEDACDEDLEVMMRYARGEEVEVPERFRRNDA